MALYPTTKIDIIHGLRVPRDSHRKEFIMPVFTSVTVVEYTEYHAIRAEIESSMARPSFGKKLQMKKMLASLYD